MLAFAISSSQIEDLLDESDLKEDIRSTDPPNLPLPHHVNWPHNPEAFVGPLGVHPALDLSVVLVDDVVQVLQGSVTTAAAQCPFLLYVGDGRAVDRCQVCINGCVATLNG